jgi:hypothetical protein
MAMLQKVFVVRTLGFGLCVLRLAVVLTGAATGGAPVPQGVDEPTWKVDFLLAYGLRGGELIRRVAVAGVPRGVLPGTDPRGV